MRLGDVNELYKTIIYTSNEVMVNYLNKRHNLDGLSQRIASAINSVRLLKRGRPPSVPSSSKKSKKTNRPSSSANTRKSNEDNRGSNKQPLNVLSGDDTGR